MIAKTDTGFEVSDLSFISETELLLVSERKGTVQRWDRKENRFTVIHSGRERAPYFASSDGRYFLVQDEENKQRSIKAAGIFVFGLLWKEVGHCDFSGGTDPAGRRRRGSPLSDLRRQMSASFQRSLRPDQASLFQPEGNRVMFAHEKLERGGGISVGTLIGCFKYNF
jgi:hypothetical protein